MNQQQFVAELSKLRPASMFLTLLGYRNTYSEIADYSLVFHFSYENAVKRSLALLQELTPQDALQELAQESIIDRLKLSAKRLSKSSIEELDDVYEYFVNEDGEYIKGIRSHRKTGVLYLYGLVNSKRVLMPGYYPDRNETDQALAKRKLYQTLPVSKFRSFILTTNHLNSISVEGLNLLPPT